MANFYLKTTFPDGEEQIKARYQACKADDTREVAARVAQVVEYDHGLICEVLSYDELQAYYENGGTAPQYL